MLAPVSRYQLSWDPVAHQGDVAFLAGDSTPVRIPVGSADDFNALLLMLKEPGVIWDGCNLLYDSRGVRTLDVADQVDLFELLKLDPNAQRIIEACRFAWPANQSDCSGFVREVAKAIKVSLSGQANEIVDQISGPGWTKIRNGIDAKQAADEGKFVIAGLKGSEQQEPSPHGHVVVVVSGPLHNGKYPTAYWGALKGTGRQNETINWAWTKADLANVKYAARSLENADY